DEEYRVAAVKDRVATTGQVWMGLTFGCAQCHTHKFDPISHKDYYSLFAIFNQSEDADREDEEPKMPVPTRDEQARRDRLNAEIATLEAQLNAQSAALEAEQHEWEALMTRPISWTPLKTLEANATRSTLKVLADGTIEAGGALNSGEEVYTLKTQTDLSGITAFRLEALTDETLPARGPGRSGNGNAVLSELRVALEPNQAAPLRGRFLRIELPGNEQMLSLAEVQAISRGNNVAPQGKARQSSTDFAGEAGRANDGNTEGDYFKANSVTHTRKEKNPWWELDLNEETEINEVVLWNRTDGGSGERLRNFTVTLLDANRQPLWSETIATAPAPSARLLPDGRRLIALANPSADFSQAGFEVARAIDNDPKTGWAFLPETGKPHTAFVETTAPVDLKRGEAGSSLVFTLRQTHGDNHALGRFRLSATNAPLPVRELPASIRAILRSGAHVIAFDRDP
ncbi:MAG: DUF1549 domain-containing protein, partial [Verrucomicrobiota bacterium]